MTDNLRDIISDTAANLGDLHDELLDVLSSLEVIDDAEWCERTGSVLLSEDQAVCIRAARDDLRRLLRGTGIC